MTQIIRRGLDDGLWTEFLPSEVELSRTLQVSRMTLRASLATLTKEGLLAASRGRKRRIVQPTRRRNNPSQNRLIVLITAKPLESLSTLHILQVEGLRAHLARSGYFLEVEVGGDAYSGQPVRALERLTVAKPAAAWILLYSSAAMQRWFMERDIPCVIIGAAHPGITIPSLGTDYRALGHHAAGMFLRRGHRRLALILPVEDQAGHANTEAGFNAAAAQVEGTSVHVIRHNGEADALMRSIAKLLGHAKPTGLLVAMPPYVLTTLSALTAAGAGVPRDVSLISRDSDTFLGFMRPTIARYVIDVPHYVKKICQATLLVSRGSVPRVRAQLLQRDFVPGETLGNVSAK